MFPVILQLLKHISGKQNKWFTGISLKDENCAFRVMISSNSFGRSSTWQQKR